MNLQKQIKMKIKWTLWQDNLQLYHQLNENITLLFLGIKDGRKHQSFGYASFCLQFYKVKQVAGKGLKILRSTEWHKKLTKILRVVLRMVQKKYGHFLWTVFNCLGVAGPLITKEILIPIRPTGIKRWKRTLWTLFMGRAQLSQGFSSESPLQGDSLPWPTPTESPEIRGTSLIHHERVKGWVDRGLTQWPGNQGPHPLSHCSK